MSIKNQIADQLPMWNTIAFSLGADNIKKGMEILSAMSTDTPWPSYMVRRKNGQSSVVKVFPFSINKEQAPEGYHQRFLDEMSKFNLIREELFAFIVPVKNWGITDEGSFPFLETEVLDAWQIDELLETGNFNYTIPEIINMAEQLTRTLAICHNVGILHGAISAHSIRFISATQKYLLDDFGITILSDEQRRTMYNNSGNADVMAPEQLNGELNFQTDVYCLGAVLYYFLTGTFFNQASSHVSGKDDFFNEMTRRRQNLALQTPGTIPLNEGLLPGWFADMIHLCLQAAPADRFSNGVELYDHLLFHQLLSSRKKQPLEVHNSHLIKEKNIPGKSKTTVPDKELHTFHRPWLRTLAFSSIGMICAFFVVMAVISSGSDRDVKSISGRRIQENKENQSVVSAKSTVTSKVIQAPGILPDSDPGKTAPVNNSKLKLPVTPIITVVPATDNALPRIAKKKVKMKQVREGYSLDLHTGLGTYQVVSKAHFYTKPDESTRRDAHIVHWNNAILKPIEATDNFVYIVFTNHWGQTSKGWLRKKDILPVEEE